LDAEALVFRESPALTRTRHSAVHPARPRSRRAVELTAHGYGHDIGTFDGRPATLHTGDNPGYKALVGWLPDGVGIVALSNDDSVQWEDVLARVL
jgi:hypothetical protein